MNKKIVAIFTLALVLNLVWEFSHAVLYVGYKGGEITNYILTRAAFWDAVILTLLSLIFLKIRYFTLRQWLILPIGIAIAYIIEVYALNTGRWEYNQLMPIVPLLKVGLSPLVQLAITGYIAFIVSVSLYTNDRKAS